MALYGKEKIWFLVNRLLDEREVTPAGKPIGLHPAQDLHNYYLMHDFVDLLSKLEKEENAAKLLGLPTDQTYLKYQIELLPDFDKYVAKLEEDPEYLEWSGKKPKPKPKGYFLDPNSRVDFSKSKEENKDKYISVGQIEEFQKLPEAERKRIMDESLTEKHIQDIEEYKGMTLKIVEDIKKNFNLKLPNLTMPALSDVKFAMPPNYEAEQVGLLRQLVAANKEKEQPASLLIAPSYYKDTKQLVFCNRIIDVSKGRDFALLCSSMFYNEKPRKQSQSLGDLLDKWQDPDHKNTKRVHNAVNNFNNFVAKFTTIDDLFYIKNKQVHFNARYI
jgi:hypothetical protein